MGLCASTNRPAELDGSKHRHTHTHTHDNGKGLADTHRDGLESIESVYAAFPPITLAEVLANDALYFPAGTSAPASKRVVLLTGRALLGPSPAAREKQGERDAQALAVLCSPVFGEPCVHYEARVLLEDAERQWAVAGEEARACAYFLVDPKTPDVRVELRGPRVLTSSAREFSSAVDPATGRSVSAKRVDDLCSQRLNALQRVFAGRHIPLTELPDRVQRSVSSANASTSASNNHSAEGCAGDLQAMDAHSFSLSSSPSCEDTAGPSTLHRLNTLNTTASSQQLLSSSLSASASPHSPRSERNTRAVQCRVAFKLAEKSVALGAQVCVLGVLHKHDSNAYSLQPIGRDTFSQQPMKRRKWTREQKAIWFAHFDADPRSKLFVSVTPALVRSRPVQRVSLEGIKISKRVPSATRDELLALTRRCDSQSLSSRHGASTSGIERSESNAQESERRRKPALAKEVSDATFSVSTASAAAPAPASPRDNVCDELAGDTAEAIDADLFNCEPFGTEDAEH